MFRSRFCSTFCFGDNKISGLHSAQSAEAECETAILVVTLRHHEIAPFLIKYQLTTEAYLLLYGSLSHVYKLMADIKKTGFIQRLLHHHRPLMTSPLLQGDTLIFTAYLMAAAKCDCMHCRCYLPVPSWA